MATVTISYDDKSSVMKHLIEAMQAAGAKVITTTDANNEFYNDEKALHLFKHSVEQEKQGLVREVSLEEIKQLLCISKDKAKQLGIK